MHGADDISSDEWVMDCPICWGTNKLCVSITRRSWHCWKCEQYTMGSDGRRRAVMGAGGLLDLIQLLDNIDRNRAIDMVLSGAIFTYRDINLLPADDIKDQVRQSVSVAYTVEPPEAWNKITGILPYMQERGISLEDATTFGLGWCNAGRYANRLVFPVWENGKFVYFQARAMWAERPGERYVKALNPSAIPGSTVSSEVLMNLDTAKAYPRVVITEGPMDCVRVGPAGVCTFGKKISATQIGKLLNAGVKAIDLMWDGPTKKEPRGAWDEMVKVAPFLSKLFDLNLVFLPKGDPGDYTRSELYSFINKATPSASVSILASV